MKANEYSNEALIFNYFMGGCDNAYDHVELAVEIQERLRKLDALEAKIKGMIDRPKVEVVAELEGKPSIAVKLNALVLARFYQSANKQHVRRATRFFNDVRQALGMEGEPL